MSLSIRGILMLMALGGLGSLGRVGEGAVLRNYDYFKYHNMSEISAWMEQIQRDNQGVVTIVPYGETYEKQSIKLLKISLASSEKKKAIWMDCGIHAREWISPAFCQYFVKQILDTYQTDEKIGQMLKNMDFYITPVLNMDGYEYTWLNDSTRLWRKSRSPGNCGDSCMGTDLNRNFAANWGTVGVSRNCCSEVYNGATVLSESEAQAVTKFVEQRSNEILCFFTIHSYGQLILLPYGHPNISAPNYDELMSVGQAAAEAIKQKHGMEYRVGTSPNVLYPNSGSSRDWARLIGIPFSFTFELRDKGDHGFKLPEEQIQPTCEEAYAGVRSIVTYVHDKAFNIAPPNAATSLFTTIWIVLLGFFLTTAPLL